MDGRGREDGSRKGRKEGRKGRQREMEKEEDKGEEENRKQVDKEEDIGEEDIKPLYSSKLCFYHAPFNKLMPNVTVIKHVIYCSHFE